MLRQSVFCFFLFLPLISFSQITGRVLDENNQPLPFASVYVQNSSKGVTANADGVFKLPLEPGEYNVVFHYIGYELHVEPVKVKPGGVKITVRLKPSVFEIGEVVITGEDPAMGIMRRAIEKREYYRTRTPDYSCEVYVKGFHKVLKLPKKIMGSVTINDTDPMTVNGNGVLYLSESVSNVYVQSKPPKTKEVMISSKVSGQDNGFNLNRATLTDFNLYNERLNIDREMLSPLADNAFNYYNFKLHGSETDANGFKIYKIAVLPKNSADPLFNGFLYVVDNWYNLAGADIFVTGAAIKQPVIDTLRIVQAFMSVEKPDKWLLLYQQTTFRIGVIGIDIKGEFNTVFSNYNTSPKYEEAFFDREEFRMEQSAGEKDSLYWAAIRPVPLTEEESRDYVLKDSVRQVRESEPYLDSLDKQNNRFRLQNLVTGYTWQNSLKRTSISWPAAYQWIQFNTVQGWLLNIEPEFEKSGGPRKSNYWKLKGALNYGFSENRFRGGVGLERRLESIYNTEFEVRTGLLTEQFDAQKPVGPFLNSFNSLVLKRNFLKIYEKAFAAVEFRRTLQPGLRVFAGAEYADRRPLSNHSNYTWYKGDREYTLNGPVYQDEPFEPYFERHQAMLINLSAEIKFGIEYSTYPGYRSYGETKWPVINVSVQQAVPVATGSPNFLSGKFQVGMDAWTWGLIGYSNWNLSAGAFLYRKKAAFIDAYHPLGNQTFYYDPKRSEHAFMLMPFYVNSTFGPYVEAHWQHHFQGFLLDKVPGLRRLNWKEVFTFNVFYADSQAVEQPLNIPAKPYWEVGFGFENIGYSAFRPLHVDVVSSFEGGKYRSTGVLLGLALGL